MLFRRSIFVPVLAAALLAVAAAVGAEVVPAPGAADDQNAPQHFDSQAEKPNSGDETLSERLDRSDGVIRPPEHVDPKIQETPPPTGDRGIVIPPPPPGSAPSLKPK